MRFGRWREWAKWQQSTFYAPIIVPTTDKAFVRTDIFLNVERMYFSSSKIKRKKNEPKKNNNIINRWVVCVAICAPRSDRRFCIRLLLLLGANAASTIRSTLPFKQWKAKKREKKNSAVDRFFLQEQEKCSSVRILFFLRQFYFRSYREGYWKSFFFFTFRSQQPNVYGPIFFLFALDRLFASDAWKCIVCNPVRFFFS